MKKYCIMGALLIVILICLIAGKKNTIDKVQEQTTDLAETEATIHERADDHSGFAGNVLEDEMPETDTVDQTSEPTSDATVETEPEETTPGNGIPYDSGEGDLLEPPANSSAGVL